MAKTKSKAQQTKQREKQSKQRKVSFTLDGREREIYVSKFVDDAGFLEFRRLVKLLVRWKRHGTPLSHRDQISVNNLPDALRDALISSTPARYLG